MTDQHPTAPPPELQEEWLGLWPQEALLRAVRWGADTELDACCEWLRQFKPQGDVLSAQLLRHRRPKPPSLAEEALATLDSMQIEPVVINGVDVNADVRGKYSTIRRALKRLQELEGQGDG